MARNFLLYWRPETVDVHLNENYLLDHAGSNQLAVTGYGDTLWIVTTGEADELCLAGVIKVDAVVSLEEASRRLGRRDLWPSRYHALAIGGTARTMFGIGLGYLAGELRFVGGGRDRLLLSASGGVDPGQLMVMRELDAGSSRLLAEIYAARRALFRHPA